MGMSPAAQAHADAAALRWRSAVTSRLKKFGLSRRQLAKAVGVGHQTVARALEGEIAPKQDLVVAITAFLELDDPSLSAARWAAVRTREMGWGPWRALRQPQHASARDGGDGLQPRVSLDAALVRQIIQLLGDARLSARVALDAVRGTPLHPEVTKKAAVFGRLGQQSIATREDLQKRLDAAVERPL